MNTLVKKKIRNDLNKLVVVPVASLFQELLVHEVFFFSYSYKFLTFHSIMNNVK